MREESIIRPSIFSGYRELRAGMSTKLGLERHNGFAMNLSYKVGDDPACVKLNRATFFTALGIAEQKLAIPLQTHSATVRIATVPGQYEACDALVTNCGALALVVTIADCVPIMLYDPVRGSIGIVHAGWRGTAAEIAGCAVRTMQEAFGTDPKNILAFIGPSAGSCCYEVGADVAVKFQNKIVPYNTTKTTIDLKKENSAQLVQRGVSPANIERSVQMYPARRRTR